MLFLRIFIFFLCSVSFLATTSLHAEVQKSQIKQAPTKKVHTQVAKKKKPNQSSAKKKTANRKKHSPVKNVVSPPKPLPAKPISPGITVVEPTAPSVPSVIPQLASPAMSAPKPAQPLSAVQKDQNLIVIDPGHGGYDLGARMSACDEKSLALSTALLTKKYLTDMGYRVVLTRSRDVFMPLEKRTTIANETKSKLFISIHFNAAKNPVAKGIEVFYYASLDKFRATSSKKLASRVLNKIIDKTVAENRGVKEGNFHVIRETKMPAILVEAGFMTHPDELHLLKDVNYRDKIARGIAEGVDSFFKT